MRDYPRLYPLFRELDPAIVHTRNLAALEAVVPAWAARVPGRIHGEHGLDMLELKGRNRKYNLLRIAVSPVVDRYIAVRFSLEESLGTGLAGRLLLGVGMACNLMGPLKLLMEWFPPSTFATVSGCFMPAEPSATT